MSDLRFKTSKQPNPQALPLKVSQASRPAPTAASDSKKPSVTLEQRDGASVRSGRSANSQRSGQSQRSTSQSGVVERIADARFRCDDCVNQVTEALHHQQRIQAKKDDIDFYRRAYHIDARIVNEERDREARKLQNFQEARDHLLQHRSQERRVQKEKEQAEKRKLHDQFCDRTDILQKEREQHEKLQKHMEGMDQQFTAAVERKKAQHAGERALAQTTHNTLIDDAWKDPQRDALKKHYYKNLVGQVNETQAMRAGEWAAEREKERQDLASTLRLQHEAARKEQILQEEKKRLFNTENAKAVQGRINTYRAEAEDRQATKEMIFQHAKNLEEISVANRDKHEKTAQATATDNLARKGETRMRALAEKIEDRKYPLTGLHVPQRVVEIHECDRCHKVKDVRKQNKVIV